MNKEKPRLYGIVNSNRDFSKKRDWGKNKFNSSFPASLCCYMHSKKIKPNYLSIKDKAFASSGNITNKYMKSERLNTPIINKSEIKEIILGGGQDLLSPERRFDAIVFNTPGLF